MVIGCRGTSVGSKGKELTTNLKGGVEDLGDDSIIAGASSNYCDLSLVALASQLAEEYKDYFIVFAGHSLGGTAAMCLTQKYPNSRGISFNGGVLNNC